MKNIFFYIVFAAFALGGCNKFLELPPDDAVLLEDAFKTPEDAQLVINAAYKQLSYGSFYGGAAWYLPELMGDNIDRLLLGGDRLAYWSRNTGIFIGETRSFWKTPYKGVYNANFVIDNMDRVEGISEAEKNRFTAEAKFLRAAVHFELVRMFGQPFVPNSGNTQAGIPLRISSSVEPTTRNTVGEVYTQIVQDLKDAAAVLPEQNGGYATKWSAKGFLATVYFQMNDFANAYAEANDVVNSGIFMLDEDYLKYNTFNAPSTESIFEMVSSIDGNGNSSGSLLGAYRSDSGLPNFYISEETYNAFVSLGGADRLAAFVQEIEAEDESIYVPTKYNPVAEAVIDIPVLHYSELVLLHAECAAETGQDLSIPRDNINAIRQRAGLSSLTLTDAASIKSEARSQRRFELFLEGNRLHELKRIAVLENDDLMIRGARWDCDGLIVQFPDEELQANPDMVTNPEGNCN